MPENKPAISRAKGRVFWALGTMSAYAMGLKRAMYVPELLEGSIADPAVECGR